MSLFDNAENFFIHTTSFRIKFFKNSKAFSNEIDQTRDKNDKK